MTEQIRLGLLENFSDREAHLVEVGATKIAIVRIGSDLYALSDQCSHADYSLSAGEVDCDERTLECWKHGAAFSLQDGVPVSLPATRAVTVYEVQAIGGEVFVTLPEKAP